MLVHHTTSAQPPNSNFSNFPRLQQGMRTLTVQEKSRSDTNNQDLYLTPPNLVLEIIELGGSKRQPFGMKAFTFFNPYTCFLHTFGGRANFY